MSEYKLREIKRWIEDGVALSYIAAIYVISPEKLKELLK